MSKCKPIHVARDAKSALFPITVHILFYHFWMQKLHWSYTSSTKWNARQTISTNENIQDKTQTQMSTYHKHGKAMVKSTLSIKTAEYSLNMQRSARITYITVHTRKSFPTIFSPDNLEQETRLLCVKYLSWIVCEFSSLTSGVQPALSFRLGSAPWARSLRTSSTSPCTEDQGQKISGRYWSTTLKLT